MGVAWMKKRHQRLLNVERVTSPVRVVWVDRLRGMAILLMVGYHFCFDLNYVGWIAQDFNHQLFWLGLRTLIVALFLGLVGVSLVLAQRDGVHDWRKCWSRWQRLALNAALVSLASYALFPESFIFFGVLHFILLVSVLGVWMLRWTTALLSGGGMVSLLLGVLVQAPFFDQPAWQWVGMMTHKPLTEDYVPLLPWLGVVMGGMALAKHYPQWFCVTPVTPQRDILGWLGRHGLWVYMAHQPVLLGGLWWVSGVRG